MTRFAALAVVSLLASSACGGGGSAHGGSGVVTVDGRVGSLQIDDSTQAAIEKFAGKPDITKTSHTAWPGVPKYLLLGYGCSGPKHKYCQTVYYVNSRTNRLAALETNSPGFRTTTGIQPGMDQNDADRRAHMTPQGPWNALGWRSPKATLILPSTCLAVTAGQCSGKVAYFMLESRHNPIGITFT
jgi:hypothetical protein